MSSKKPAKKAPQKNIKTSSGLSKMKIAYAILVIFGIIFYYYCKSFDFIQDDSYITYRYVKNFTEGNGLVFNTGEKVEGYTCFLWVIILSFVKVLGFNFISASQTLGIISSLLTLFITYRISSKIFPKNRDTFYNLTFSLIAVLLVAVNGSFAYWTVSGMETGLFGFLVTLGVYLYLAENKNKKPSLPLSSIVFLLAAMTRPEGNLIFAITVLHKIIIILKSKSSDSQSKAKILISKNNLLWFAIYIIPALIFMFWRYSYYGYLFPNTFYAKTGSSLEYFKTGLDYFWQFAKDYGLYGVLIALTLVNLKKKERLFDILYLLMIFFIFCVYVIFIGGDVLRPNRFFVPIMPVFFILVQEGLNELISLLDKKRSFIYDTILGLAFAVGFSYYTYKNEYEQIKKFAFTEKGLVEKMMLTAGWLKTKQTDAGRPLVVAATTIGAVSYYSEVTLIDMLGLTDKEVAHNPQPIAEISSREVGWRERNYNVGYILSRKPDYIYFSTGLKPSAFAERGLFTSDEFIKYYYPYYFIVKEKNTGDIIYKRRSDEQAGKHPLTQPNPNYQKSFVNLYNQAMNTSRDKTKIQEAISLFQQSIEKGPPGWGTPYQLIGELYAQANDTAKAFENYKKAADTDDYNVIAHVYLYRTYTQRGDTANALKSLEKIQKYNPDLVQ
ncbi:MAG: hypothetical protein L0Y79_04005 [Chlorobi bacterium]|nr:hypothetical protein [Chlorobiota bacterium]MCI0717281.1 hypothetical protein [Chlorobiota bacterium]